MRPPTRRTTCAPSAWTTGRNYKITWLCSQHLPKLEVTQKLTEIGYSMGMVQDVADLDRCPHLEARGMFVDFPNTLGGQFRAANTPIRLAGSVGTPAGSPPEVGEHNQEILCGIGGVSPDDLEKMKADGVV